MRDELPALRPDRQVPPEDEEDEEDEEDDLGYCDNDLCVGVATQTVSVSVEGYADQERNYCECCYEAFMIGVQHGRWAHATRDGKVTGVNPYYG